jgi:hypothetical protein
MVLAGCDLFSTRDPEPPTVRGSGIVPPTSPSIVLDNLKSAIASKNSSDYMRCLLDTLSSDRSYLFIPTAGATARYPSIFSYWGLQTESSYFANLAALTETEAPSSLVLNGGFDLFASDSAIYNAEYELTFRHGVSNVPEVVTGTLQFTLATDRSNFWSIIRWTDLPKGTEASWSDLKGRFAN